MDSEGDWSAISSSKRTTSQVEIWGHVYVAHAADGSGSQHRYYPMHGFGNFAAASRFCRAFNEQRQYFRLRTTMRERVPPLAEQRREHCARWTALMSELMAA